MNWNTYDHLPERDDNYIAVSFDGLVDMARYSRARGWHVPIRPYLWMEIPPLPADVEARRKMFELQAALSGGEGE